MNSLRILVLILAGVLSSPFLRASVNVTNTTPCTTLKVMIKQYIFTDGNLGSCPAWEASVAYGATLSITDYFQSWHAPDEWGYQQYHSYEVRYEAQYTYSVAAACPPTACRAWALEATDADHSSRTRQILRSEGTGGMVVVGAGHTLNLSVSYEGGCSPPSGYPVWSGTGVSGSGHSATWTGNSSSTVTVQANPTDTMSINIQVVSANEQSVSLSAEQLWISEIEQKIRSGVQTVTNTSTNFDISGTIGGTYKKVCRYNNASTTGNYLTLLGGMSGSFWRIHRHGPAHPARRIGFCRKAQRGNQWAELQRHK